MVTKNEENCWQVPVSAKVTTQHTNMHNKYTVSHRSCFVQEFATSYAVTKIDV